MNYQEMSDFEINCRVHFADCSNLRYEKGIFKYTEKSGRDGSIGKYLYKTRNPDYCNSWADAGPIIHENRICIVADGEEPCSLGTHGGHQWWCASSDCRTFQCNYQSNPLRAAMITFLMMQEASNG